jgi:arsenate reductase-like glutaredoxin family protein
MSYGNDEACAETRKFVEDGGVILQVRDIEKEPLSADELFALIGHLRIDHFLNKSAASYTEHRLDKSLPPREEIIKLMAQDHTLLRRPIIKSSRLITVGCDKRKIAEMLQLSNNGDGSVEDPPQPKNHRGNKKAHAARS